MRPEQWIIEGEVGTSSKTIWAVMMGVVREPTQCNFNYDVPHDPDDFSRCYKLLCLFPYWEGRLWEVAKVFPKWEPFVREWTKLKELYPQWQSNVRAYYNLPFKERKKFKFNDGMYEFMRKLDDEGMLLDGWVKDSPCSWHRPQEGGEGKQVDISKAV